VCLAFAAGILLALSFPKFGHPAFAWIALAPLLITLRGGTLSGAFARGWICGVVYFAGTLYWITHVMVLHGGLQPVVAGLVNAALVAYLALFPAFFAAAVRRLYGMFGSLALLAVPSLWVASELGRTYLFTGFPWVLLGYSQVTVLPVAQLASLIGVYGISALVASVSAAIVGVVTDRSPLRYAAAAAVSVALVGVVVWGALRVRQGTLAASGTPLRVGLVQGNVSQIDKWSPAHAAAIFHSHLRMTRDAVSRGAQIVLWPESSTPFHFAENPAGAGAILDIARDARVAILLGSDELDRGVPTRYYNSAFLVRPDGTVGPSYRKMHLVPFGEYVPLKQVFFFAAPLVEAVSDFAPGESPVLLEFDGHRLSTAICYEIVYPNLVRAFVRDGSELLTTITNDAWFGDTSAPYQHFAQASMRAIENGRYLVRAANTGISGIVDPYGRIVAASPLFQPAVMVHEARLLRHATIYARVGDVFAYASVAVVVALAFPRRRKNRYNGRNGDR
jgi:apolipoprotein N-acyltransferase